MSPLLATKINALAILIICGVLLGAYFIQFVEGELPCPLCLLQRLALLGVVFGAMLNLRYGIRPRHYGVSLLSAALGASISIRQILLHISPIDGTSGYGSPIFGYHLYTWAFIVFAVSIVLIAVMMLLKSQFELEGDGTKRKVMTPFTKAVFFLVVVIAAANVVTTFLECGFLQCPDNPKCYIELT